MAEQATTKARVLVVEDEQEHAQVMCEALQRQGHACDITHSLAEAEAKLNRKTYDIVVTDLLMDGRRDGMEVLRRARLLRPAPPVLLVTALNDVPTSKQAMSEGAYDYIIKPLDLQLFRAQVNRAAEMAALQKQNQVLQEQLDEQQGGFEGIIGRSAAMQQVVKTARQFAASDLPILILGESGTGKELIARAIHNNSPRRKHRMVALNCAGLNENILEDELFGHVRGAFTGAQTEREGRFEHADRGTLFMDEIGDMPQSMQAKLLRVLENGEVVRVGSNDPVQVDVRLISATNQGLREMVEEKRFREDLYFRINGVTIDLPPLRERRDDVPLLVHFFVKQFGDKHGKVIEQIAPDAMQRLVAYHWPGNVRELRSTVERMMVQATGPTLGPELLPRELRPAADAADRTGGLENVVGLSLEQLEKEAIRNTLKMTHGNREQAAKILGIGERTLYRKIKDYGLS